MSNFKELDEFKKLGEVKELSALWFSLPQPIRFIIAGGYNTAVGYILFIAAVYVFGRSQTGVQAALLSSYILSSFNSYLVQKFLVFRTKGNYIKEYFKALSVWAAGYVINAVLLYLFTKKLNIHPYAAQALSVCLVTFFTYVLFKYYSFRRSAE
ncbi:MAG: GtrA family protein [Elusimicrobiaceae bacterium]